MRSGTRAAVIALGAVSAGVLLLSPAVLPDAAASVLVPAVLPLGFFAAGGTAQVLRPGHPVADRLLAVGVLHLVALLGAAIGALRPPDGVAVPVAWLSALLYALGFVALLDLLARYPTGQHAWPWVGGLVRAAAMVSLAVVTIGLLASDAMPSVLGLESGVNPAYVPGLAGLSGVVAVLGLLPVVGVLLLLARYPGAPAADRAQMRWPMVTAGVIGVALLTTGWAEDALGSEAQTALFVTAGTALPGSFLIGLLRHTEEAERLAALEASRARLAAVADDERRRIERALHAGAQQQLLALLARVELARGGLASGDAVDRELAAIAEDLRTVHRDLRELARGVYPAVLTDHGLAEAVRSAMQRVPGEAHLEVAPGLESARFAPAVEGAAYFVVLEGLANALRHARPGAVDVRLDRHGDRLEVTVGDAGPGFDPDAAVGAGTGLVGLRDRLAAAGGTLEIDSRPGSGTTLRAQLPARVHAAG